MLEVRFEMKYFKNNIMIIMIEKTTTDFIYTRVQYLSNSSAELWYILGNLQKNK